MAKSSPATELRHHSSTLAGRQALINIAIFAAVVAVFGTQIGSLNEILEVFGQADGWLVTAALLTVAMTFPVAAMSYRSLSDHPVSIRSTILVQVSSGFVNRLLPIGLGSLGLYVSYFKRHGMSIAAGTALVMTNNILGIIGTLLLAAGVFVFHPDYLTQLRSPALPSGVIIVVFIVVVVTVVLIILRRPNWKRRVGEVVHSIGHAMRLCLRPDNRTRLSFVFNVLLTVLNATILSLSVAAMHGSLDWPAALLVLSIGTLVGAAVPTPGGIGGVEAGLLASMMAFGVTPAVGLASVLLYRGLTYWLPIIPGIIAFRHIRRRYL